MPATTCLTKADYAAAVADIEDKLARQRQAQHVLRGRPTTRARGSMPPGRTGSPASARGFHWERGAIVTDVRSGWSGPRDSSDRCSRRVARAYRRRAAAQARRWVIGGPGRQDSLSLSAEAVDRWVKCVHGPPRRVPRKKNQAFPGGAALLQRYLNRENRRMIIVLRGRGRRRKGWHHPPGHPVHEREDYRVVATGQAHRGAAQPVVLPKVTSLSSHRRRDGAVPTAPGTNPRDGGDGVRLLHRRIPQLLKGCRRLRRIWCARAPSW